VLDDRRDVDQPGQGLALLRLLREQGVESEVALDLLVSAGQLDLVHVAVGAL
jgi:hypothetical protein